MPTDHRSIAEAFAEDGFYHARQVFRGDLLGSLQDSFAAIVEQLRASQEDINANWQSAVERLDTAERIIIHTHQVHLYDAIWLRALKEPAFLAIATELLGDHVILHHTKLFHKPPRVGGGFPLHQDWAYFPTELDTMLAGVIHLSEASPANGCLRVIPGSHRLGRRKGLSGNASHHDGEDLDFLANHRLEDAVPVSCEPGDVLFFHYFTLHGSMPNDSDQARQTVLVQLYAGDDTTEDESKHANARLPLCGRNFRIGRSLAGKTGVE